MKIDVVLSPPEIDLLPERDLRGATCVVFDVLRATTSILTALQFGASEIFPVLTIEEAHALRAKNPRALLAGERHGDRIDGFDLGNSPDEYTNLAGAQVITTTTNGTVALRACANATEILPGALVNMEALTTHLRDATEVVLVCAGTFRDAALEDIFAAGLFCRAFDHAELTDAARVARSTCAGSDTDCLRLLQSSRNGQALARAGREADVKFCSQLSCFPVLGAMKNGVIRAIPRSS